MIVSPSLDEGDRAAGRRLGRHVADHEAVRRAAEAAVGDEGHRAAEPLPDEGGGHAEHLGHAGGALRPLVADDDDVAGLDPLRLHRLERRGLAVEDAGRARVREPLVPDQLRHAPLGGERAAEDREAAGRLDRIPERPDDLLPGGLDGVLCLGEERPAGDGDLVLQLPGVGEPLRDEADAPRALEVDRREASARLQVGEDRRPAGDRVEVVERERHAALARDREEVEDGVRGAARRHDGRDGVLERLPGQDLRGASAS